MSAILRWGCLLSHYIGGSSLLVEDEVENLWVVLEFLKTGFIRSELSSVFLRLR